MNEVELNSYRIERLEAAVERISAGNRTDFGKRLGYADGAFVRQMLAGKRAVSEKTIRTVESLHGMKGWFALAESAEDESTSAGAPDVRAWPLKRCSVDRLYALTATQLEQADVMFDVVLKGIESSPSATDTKKLSTRVKGAA